MLCLRVMYIPDEGSPHIQRFAGLAEGRLHTHGFDLLDLKQLECSVVLKNKNCQYGGFDGDVHT